MYTATELLYTRPVTDAAQARFDGDAALECDRCGRAVHRETAFEHGDEDETVLVCPECELGD